MRKKLSMEELYPIMLEEFREGRTFKMITNGTSMLPFIGNGCDTVILKEPEGTLKKYDIPLYRREDGSFALHRIIGKDKHGYIMCGDNQFIKEYGITDDNIVAVMTGLIKNGEVHELRGAGYKAYCIRLCALRPIRKVYIAFKRRIKALLKIGKK